jgi:hypothetical protein
MSPGSTIGTVFSRRSAVYDAAGRPLTAKSQTLGTDGADRAATSLSFTDDDRGNLLSSGAMTADGQASSGGVGVFRDRGHR